MVVMFLNASVFIILLLLGFDHGHLRVGAGRFIHTRIGLGLMLAPACRPSVMDKYFAT
jgi:hypothetical protein